MNKNFTPAGKSIVANLQSASSKVVVTALAIFFSTLSTISAKSSNLSGLNAGFPTATGSGIFDVRGEKIGNASLDIFLNATQTEATVNLNNLSLYNNVLSITDMIGTTVISVQAFSGSSIKLSINNLKPGIYIVKVATADGAAAQRKMIVTNR